VVSQVPEVVPDAMTRAEFRARFPHASEAVIAANCPTPRPLAPKPAKPSPVRPKRTRTARTRNGGTWTEARYWQQVRSALRRAFRFWQPIQRALRAARTPAPGPRGRKWLYLCAGCGRLHLRRHVEVDHVVPCGELSAPEHVALFLARLTPEDPTAFRVLCLVCHRAKTAGERALP
jgi:5-methylcytosine-specific restriction endonuclease McrA